MHPELTVVCSDTQTDFLCAKKLGFTMELIEDGQANALIYSSDKCMKAHDHQIFGDYVEKLFSLKKANVPKAKELLNMLWGSLSEKNKTDTCFTPGDSFGIPDNSSFI